MEREGTTFGPARVVHANEPPGGGAARSSREMEQAGPVDRSDWAGSSPQPSRSHLLHQVSTGPRRTLSDLLDFSWTGCLVPRWIPPNTLDGRERGAALPGLVVRTDVAAGHRPSPLGDLLSEERSPGLEGLPSDHEPATDQALLGEALQEPRLARGSRLTGSWTQEPRRALGRTLLVRGRVLHHLPLVHRLRLTRHFVRPSSLHEAERRPRRGGPGPTQALRLDRGGAGPAAKETSASSASTRRRPPGPGANAWASCSRAVGCSPSSPWPRPSPSTPPTTRVPVLWRRPIEARRPGR
jgi:hypothetical protein